MRWLGFGWGRMGTLAAGLVLAATVGLTGCSQTPPVRAGLPTVGETSDDPGSGAPDSAGSTPASAAPSGSAPAPTGSAASSPVLAAQKQAAGLPDCPATDPTRATPTNGPSGLTLPDLTLPDLTLPDLTLPCLGGGRATRLAGLRGTPMVINVWASWCGPCRTEAPTLAEVSRQAGDRLMIIGVDYDDPKPDLAIEFARASGWSYPQLYDRERAITAALGLPAFPPQTIFVRADGTVAGTKIGPFTSADDLRAQIADRLGVRL